MRKLLTASTIKGILCCSIFAFHFLSNVKDGNTVERFFSRYGNSAVSCFFVLSGFLIWRNYIPISSVKRYINMLTRRVWNVYPLHILTLLFCVAAFLLVKSPLAGRPTSVVKTLPSLALLHSFIPAQPEIRQCWNGVSWFLSALFFCWLAHPPIFNLIRKGKRLKTLICLITLCYTVLISGTLFKFFSAREVIYFFPPTRFLEFTTGAMAGLIFQKKHLPVAVFFLIPAALVSFAEPYAVGLFIAPWIALLITFMCTPTRDKLCNTIPLKPFQLIGDLSFEFFMTHAIVLGIALAFVTKYAPNINRAISFLSILAVSVATAWLTHKVTTVFKKPHTASPTTPSAPASGR